MGMLVRRLAGNLGMVMAATAAATSWERQASQDIQTNLVNATTPYSAADPAYNTSIQHFACGTESNTYATNDFTKTISRLAAKDSSPLQILSKRGKAKLVIPLYVHVVTTLAKANTITQADVNQQVRVMNAAYNPKNIFFRLQGTDFTANDAWAVGDPTTNNDLLMKQALRRGTYSALNIYLQTDLAGGILGKCSLPTNIGSNPSAGVYVGDGCNCAAGTMPGGPILGYNHGMTVVHETGHWLGLLHTFEGYSCSGPGDYITDTAVESQSTSGCPTMPWKNSCVRSKSFFLTRRGDPIRNYMDYSIDICYAGFTQGQIIRINDLWKLYRANR